jgi:hypothetical protein
MNIREIIETAFKEYDLRLGGDIIICPENCKKLKHNDSCIGVNFYHSPFVRIIIPEKQSILVKIKYHFENNNLNNFVLEDFEIESILEWGTLEFIEWIEKNVKIKTKERFNSFSNTFNRYWSSKGLYKYSGYDIEKIHDEFWYKTVYREKEGL